MRTHPITERVEPFTLHNTPEHWNDVIIYGACPQCVEGEAEYLEERAQLEEAGGTIPF
jgi:hypothetical protein